MNEDSETDPESTVTIKPNAQMCSIREQILRDPASGLTFQFELDEKGRTRFRVFGEAIPAGSWEVGFENGRLSFTGTQLATCKPTWLTNPDEL